MMSEHLWNPSRGATSRVMRKYGSWSMAQGMRQRMSLRSPNIWGKDVGKAGAACVAGKDILPMLSSPFRPNMAFMELNVTHLTKHRPSCGAAEATRRTVFDDQAHHIARTQDAINEKQ